MSWTGPSQNVDIEREFGAARTGLISIHDYLDRELSGSGATVVYYDHGTGEIADFVAFERRDERLTIRCITARDRRARPQAIGKVTLTR